jgi:hypothetical protein
VNPLLPGIFATLAPLLDSYGYLAVGGLVFVEDFGVPAPGETILIAAAVYAGGLDTGTPRKHHHTATRPMTSGERQYRTGCRRGYSTQGCDQFAAPRLLQHGIDPYL